MAQSAGYSFNSDTVSGSTVRDLAGYFLSGTIVGSAAIVAGKAGYGNALNCTGGALQIKVAADTYPVSTVGGIAGAAWVKLDDTTAVARCAISGKDSAALRWALYASNASGNVEVNLMGTTYATTTSIRDGGWHHLLFSLSHGDTPGNETLRIAVDGVQVQSYSALDTGLGYPGGSIVIEAGRNGFTGLEPLNGLVDDFRWWNDPVDSTSWAGIRDTEQVDLQWAIYAFDGTTEDLGIYNRDLTKTANGSFVDGFYGKALQSTGAGAAATGTVSFGDMDRLALTGYMRLDVAPVGSAAPIMAITNSGGANKLRAVVNTDRTVTLTWETIYGTFSVTSATALTVGSWARFHFNMNPTYVGIRLDSNTQQTTSTGNLVPHLTPTVNDLNVLYVGGDSATGGQVSFDYLNCTRNFLDVPKNNYWTGPANHTAIKPTNSARGVYEFNENVGTAVNDLGASNNDLTVATGAVWIGAGIEGSALGEGLSTGQAAGRTGLTWSAVPTGWAFAGWFRCRSASAGARIIAMRNGTSEVAHAFYLTGAFRLRLYGAGGNTGILIASAYPSVPTFPAETWTHLAASCNGLTVQFFINGVHIGSADYAAGTLLQPTTLRVGGDDGDGSGEGVADVDSLQMFDTPLSRSAVQWLYENPGQFASSVTVSSSRSTTWNTRARITASRAATWDALAAITASRATTWRANVRLTTSRVTTWVARARLTVARSSTWAVATASQLTASRATAWTSKALIAASRATTWDTRQSLTSTRATSWAVSDSPTVTASRSTTWAVERDPSAVTPRPTAGITSRPNAGVTARP